MFCRPGGTWVAEDSAGEVGGLMHADRCAVVKRGCNSVAACTYAAEEVRVLRLLISVS